MKYWSEDDQKNSTSTLPEDGYDLIDAKNRLVLFDGCRAHATSKFRGMRYSLVVYSCAGAAGVIGEDLTVALET